jgi:bacillopeptidase F (M6 metalloprotease family)
VKAPVASTTAHTGAGSALLGVVSGNEPLGDSTLSQTITVPATGTSTLSFWYQPHTQDETCTGAACRYDWMEAQVRNTSGTTLASLFKLCNDTGTWTQVTADLTAYKGQTITLWFNVHVDGSSPADNSWMYLDDVALTNR